MRDGQWVCWIGNVPGAHRARNGKVVGVYNIARSIIVDTAGNRIEMPARCIPVTKDEGGPIPSGEDLSNLEFLAEQCQGLEPITDRADIPAKRLEGNPTWRPRP